MCTLYIGKSNQIAIPSLKYVASFFKHGTEISYTLTHVVESVETRGLSSTREICRL